MKKYRPTCKRLNSILCLGKICSSSGSLPTKFIENATTDLVFSMLYDFYLKTSKVGS